MTLVYKYAEEIINYYLITSTLTHLLGSGVEARNIEISVYNQLVSETHWQAKKLDKQKRSKSRGFIMLINTC